MRRQLSFYLGSLMAVTACTSNAPAVQRPRVHSAAIAAPDQATPPEPRSAVVAAVTPKIEVVFVLDTTGSMANLIDGAKQKIWSIADELASGRPKPELRIGLVAYRDRGDTYVTQHFPLTNDLDTVYQQLHSLSADGGGDGPESVNQALYEAVHGSTWSNERNVYRTVFLVGDAPPHMDYQDDVPYTETARLAAEKGIAINTVQCGEMQETKPVWLAIAHASQGTYAAIEQSGGMLQIAAPMDDEIGQLNARLSATVVPYGHAEEQRKVRAKADMALAAPAAVSASRHSYLSKGSRGVVTGGGDLVEDLSQGKVALDKLKEEDLPSELRAMTPTQRTAELERRTSERKALQDRLDKLVKERNAYVKQEESKRRAAGAREGFDGEVMKAVKAQAAEAGIAY